MSLLDTTVPVGPAPKPSPFYTMTIVAVVLSALSVMWAFVDHRMVGDAAVWGKPLKFGISFAVLFGTIAWVEALLSQKVRNGWPMRIVAWIMGIAFIAEMAYITYQGARAEASHFNVSTPFHEFMYTTVMGAGAVALVACCGVIGWIVRSDKQASLGASLREGIWLGFLLSFVLTMIVAMYMSMRDGHHVGVHGEGAPTLPLFGWSRATGDLRPAHFLALHAMQVLPAIGVLLDRHAKTKGVQKMRIAAGAYSILTLIIFGQALLGLPLIPKI